MIRLLFLVLVLEIIQLHEPHAMKITIRPPCRFSVAKKSQIIFSLENCKIYNLKNRIAIKMRKQTLEIFLNLILNRLKNFFIIKLRVNCQYAIKHLTNLAEIVRNAHS